MIKDINIENRDRCSGKTNYLKVKIINESDTSDLQIVVCYSRAQAIEFRRFFDKANLDVIIVESYDQFANAHRGHFGTTMCVYLDEPNLLSAQLQDQLIHHMECDKRNEYIVFGSGTYGNGQKTFKSFLKA